MKLIFLVILVNFALCLELSNAQSLWGILLGGKNPKRPPRRTTTTTTTTTTSTTTTTTTTTIPITTVSESIDSTTRFSLDALLQSLMKERLSTLNRDQEEQDKVLVEPSKPQEPLEIDNDDDFVLNEGGDNDSAPLFNGQDPESAGIGDDQVLDLSQNEADVVTDQDVQAPLGGSNQVLNEEGDDDVVIGGEEVSTEAPENKDKKRVIVDPSLLQDCRAPGTFPLIGDCSRFLLCQAVEGRLRGFRYKCPDHHYFGHLNLYPESALTSSTSILRSSSILALKSPLFYARCLPKDQVRCPWEPKAETTTTARTVPSTTSAQTTLPTRSPNRNNFLALLNLL